MHSETKEKQRFLSIRGEKESSLTYSNNTYTDVTLDLGGGGGRGLSTAQTPRPLVWIGSSE